MTDVQPILAARGLMKRYGTVVAMNGADFDLYPGEIVAVIGDNLRSVRPGSPLRWRRPPIASATTPKPGLSR